jgi:aminoglycoside phosphotransferase (APT) family kinase protein
MRSLPELEALSLALSRIVAKRLGPPGTIEHLERLTGGATRSTWAFAARVGETTMPLILQQAGARTEPPGDPIGRLPRVHGESEARLLRAAARAGVPAPPVRLVVTAEDGAGPGLITDRVEGESLGGRIVRAEGLAGARAQMAAQCGRILARLHRIDPVRVPFLVEYGPATQLALYRAIYESFDHPQPAIELGLSWAAANLPASFRLGVVHGDFRTGNLIVAPTGIRAVLDWEGAHLGDPMEDLGWLCVKTWRFGGREPVGGFGRREDLFEAYEDAGGGRVDSAAVAIWETWGCLKWSILCMMKGQSYRRGGPRTVEGLAIGRRVEEPLLDFLDIVMDRVRWLGAA